MTEYVLSHFNYWAFVILMMVGLYVVFSTGNMVKKLVGLGVFQTSVFLFYISLGKVAGGQPPILPEHPEGDAADHAPAAAGAAHSVGPESAVDLGADETTAGAGVTRLEDGHELGESVATGAPAVDVASATAHEETGETVHFSAEALDGIYSNPLPHVLILTAIVVGVATLAVGLALVVRIREAYGSIEDQDVSEAEYDTEVKGADA